MRTDDLIARLAADTGVVRSHAVERRFAVTLLTGAVVALGALMAFLGPRPDLGSAAATLPFWLKFGFTALVGALGLAASCRLARPGARLRTGFWLLAAAPFAVLALLAAAELLGTPPPDRVAVWLGDSWKTCAAWIAALSAPLLLAVTLAMRRFAPTRPALAGMMLGMTAGGVGATIYGLHCQENAAAFLATWYVLGMALVGAAGAAVGRWALRW
ncbi:MAG: NrsF family protein [Pseudomonadota bacterium]